VPVIFTEAVYTEVATMAGTIFTAKALAAAISDLTTDQERITVEDTTAVDTMVVDTMVVAVMAEVVIVVAVMAAVAMAAVAMAAVAEITTKSSEHACFVFRQRHFSRRHINEHSFKLKALLSVSGHARKTRSISLSAYRP
jgi:hypothetical protein